MNIERIEPRVITYRLTPNRSDSEYCMCKWAKFIFDCDDSKLSIKSDVGDYSYGWGYDEQEDFMHLMGRVDAEYLLDKISNRTVFNIEKSKERTISNIKKYGHYVGIKDHKRLERIVEEINDIHSGVSKETFLREADTIVPEIDWGSIEIVNEYPCGAVTAVNLFIKYLQPEIKKEF